MKHEYKIDTGLWYYQCETSKDREKFMFDSDEKAWNKLRLVIPNKFAVLYRKESVSVLINNHKKVVEKYNAKYRDGSLSGMYREFFYWKPVLYGITDDEYKIGG